MNSIAIDTGEKRILIDDDPKRVIVFNPSDVAWAERFQAMKLDITTEINEFPKRAQELEDQKKGADDTLLNEIEKQGNALRRKVCEYMRSRIDDIFGKGTSQICFGDLMSEIAIASFLEGITPYIEIVRADKIAKYTVSTKAGSKRVMK